MDGAGHDSWLLLYVDEGRLSGLGSWRVADDPPDEFFPVEAIGNPLPG